MNVSIDSNNEYIEEDIDIFDNCLHQHDEIISESSNRIYQLIKDFKKV
ncbi:MAG: DUF6530 family protein [Candidatus Marinimicrobia bacterium]|nr:DUF6530 family protein [Candidatus Neomarinimicrobiota bacterium]